MKYIPIYVAAAEAAVYVSFVWVEGRGGEGKRGKGGSGRVLPVYVPHASSSPVTRCVGLASGGQSERKG